METTIEITKLSGEVIHEEKYPSELLAQKAFDEMACIKHPNTYKGISMNLSEWPEGRCGSVTLVHTSAKGNRYERRELYRKP